MEGMIQASDGNSADCSEATKTILEDVCMDFESMDVINPKSSKNLYVPKSRPDSSQKSANVQSKYLGTAAVSAVVHSTNMLEVQSESNPLPAAVGNIYLNAVVQNETGSSDITLEQSENDLLQQSYCAAVGHTTSAIEANSEAGVNEDHTSISFISGDFSHNENIPSMAQLADAEIIQTDENSVSIIITNPRLIKLMTNADNSLSSAMASASMLDPSASMLESAIGASEQMGVVDSSEISTFKIEDIGLSDNTSVLNNIFVETEAEISNCDIPNIEISNTELKEKRHKRGRPAKKKDQPSVPVKAVGRGKAPKLAVVPKPLQTPPPPATTGTTTKARRITAKMKDAWTKQLQKVGCLVCHLPGCSQTYVTVANFATHYKYCTGKKNLQHCLYCDSLIFSSNKAVLQHMEVEHPDKVEEYKAKYPEASAAYDEGNLPSHLIVAEDENVAMNVEEVTQPQRKKRKLIYKENVLSPPKAISKHKMKCINESVNENIKEFKKCVRFDNIVDKINSVDEFSRVVENVTEIKPPKKQKKKRVYVTGKIVAQKEYFEDDDTDIISQEEQEEAKTREMMHTKARMVLNLERYKRYKEYLKLTRDWSSERKTYSRSRGSDTSLDTSYLLALQNEYLQDVHQLHATEEQSANISLDVSQITDSRLELETTPNDLTSLQTYEVIQTDKFVSVQPIKSRMRSNVTSTPISQIRQECPNNLSLNLNDVSSVAIDLPPSSFETTRSSSFVLNKERVPCYNRFSLPGNVVCKSETPRPKRFGSAITFGVNVPAPASKPPEPTITFDTLINLSQKQVKNDSQANSDKMDSGKMANNFIREDGVKHPVNSVDNKLKKGQPFKSNLDFVIDGESSPSKMVMGKNKNVKSKKYSAAVLKSIKNNVRNRKAKLLKLKNTSKLKCDSKKIIKISQLRTNRLNLRNAQQKRSYQNLSSVNDSLQDLKQKASEEESIVQCVENIDNHISLSGNITQIECFTDDHNYSHPTDISSVDPINNVAGEVEITSSNIEDIEAGKIIIDPITNDEEGAVVQPLTSNFDTREVEAVDNVTANIDLKKIPAEVLNDSQELEYNSKPSMQHDTESIYADTQVMDKVAVSQTPENITDIHVAENIIDINVAENVTDTQIAEKIYTNTQIAEKVDTDSQIAGKIITDVQIAEKVNIDTLIAETDTPIAHRIDADFEIAEKLNFNISNAQRIDTVTEGLNAGAEIAEKIIDTGAKISENLDFDTLIDQRINIDAEKIDIATEIAEKIVTYAEIAENIDNDDEITEKIVSVAENSEEIVTDAVIVDKIISVAEISEKIVTDAVIADTVNVSAQISENLDTASQIVEKVDINRQSAESTNMDTGRVVTDIQTADSITINFTENNKNLVEGNSIGASMEVTPIIQTIDAEIIKLLPVPGTLDSSESIPLISDNHVSSLSGDIELKKNYSEEKSAEVQKVSTEVKEISTAAEATSVQIQEFSANALSENNAQSEELPLNDEFKLKQQMPSNEVNANSKKSEVPENSESNAKSEVPEVKVKRGRGRPRKIQCEVTTPVKKDSRLEAKVTSEVVDIAKENVTQEDSMMQSSGDENRSGRGWRKSERVKKRKLAEEEPVQPKVETSKEESIPVLKTGKRGRRRKYPLTDSDPNPPVNNDTPPKPSVTENEVVDENLRKFSRKGRPRKCVRYADLNSGIESSESLDGLNSGISGKDKQDDTAVVKEVDNAQDVYEKEKQEEKILPLKKRKQRQSRKDESVTENAGQQPDSENISPDKKKIKLDDHVENEQSIKGGRVLRTRKSTSKKYADDYELDDPLDKDFEEKAVDFETDEIYNPEEKIESSVKKLNSKSSRKSAAKIALAANNKDESQKSTSKKYANEHEFDDPRDKDFNVKDVNSESDESYDPEERNESLTKKGTSTFSRKLAAKIALMTGDNNESFLHPKVLFPEFKPKKYMWKLLSGMDYYDFLPPLKNSVYFKIKNAWQDSEPTWSSLRCFDSLPIDKESSHITFFTGGPVLCSAWCPTPADSTQYIAVAVSSTLNKHQSYICTDAEKGLIQLWNLGHLTDKLNCSKPVMELGISHNHGFISDMAWCPAGCWENPASESTDGFLPRLGMLAVSCSDSYIRIYSIPQVCYLTKQPTSVSLYSPCPSVILQPMYGGECMATRKSMCVCVSWQKTDSCERIVGGYGNGMVCIWLINSSATILVTKGKDQTIISPYLIFSAHGTPVTSVSFSPLSGARFLLTSSTDKTLKFWDLFDTSLPFFSVRKGASRYAEWAPNMCGAIASLDYGMCSWKGASFFKECGTENSSSRNCAKSCCSIRRSSFTDWLNAQAHGDLSGEVSVSFLNGPKYADAKGPMFFCRFVYQAKVKLIEGKVENLPTLNELQNGFSTTCPEEMQDVVDGMIENCDIMLQLNTFDETVQTTVTALNPKRLRKKRRRSKLEAEDCFSESQNCLEAADVASLVTDMKDVVSVMNRLVEPDSFKISVAVPNNQFIDISQSTCISTSKSRNDLVWELSEKCSTENVKISNILCNIVKEVGRRAERELEISSILNNIVAEVTNKADISDVLNTIVAEVTSRAEISDVLNNIVAEVRNTADISDVLNNIVVEVRNRTDISDVLNNIVAEVKNMAEISDVLNNIVAEVRNRAEIFDVLNNIVTEVRNRAEISDVLNNIVTEVINRTKISYVLNNIVTEVINRAEISDVLNHIVTEVRNAAEIFHVLNDIVTEVRNRAEISDVLKDIVTEIGNLAEISNVLNNIVTDVKNRAEVSDVLNNIVAEVKNRAEVSDVLNNIVAEVESKAEISDVLNDIVTEIENRAESSDVLDNIIAEVNNRAEISDVLNNIVAEARNRAEIFNVLNNIVEATSTAYIPDDLSNVVEVRNRAEIFDVLHNIVADVKNRAENESEIFNILNKIVTDVGNRVVNEVEIANVLNNILAKTKNRAVSEIEIANVLNDIVAEVRNGTDNNIEISNILNNIVAEVSTIILHSKNNVSGISLENNVTNKIILEITNEGHEDFVLQNKHSAVDCGKVCHNKTILEKAGYDETLTDFQTKYSRKEMLLNECIASCNTEPSEECSEASALMSETTDLISLIADMKDLICTAAKLMNNDNFPPQLFSVFEVDQLQEDYPAFPSIGNYMKQLKSYPEILSQNSYDCSTENSVSFTISDLLHSLVRRVSERIASHPEIRKLSNRVDNETAVENSGGEEILMSDPLGSSSVKASVVKVLEDIQMEQNLNKHEDVTSSSRLLNPCLEIRDLASLVADMKDVVSTISHLATDSDKGNENKISTCDSLLLVKPNVNDPIENVNCFLPNNSSEIISDMLCKLLKAVVKLSNHTDRKLCEDTLLSEKSTAIKTMGQMESCSIESIQDKEKIDAKLPHSCSEMLEIVSLMADVEDVVSVAAWLPSGRSNLVRNEKSAFSSELKLGDLPSEISTLQREQELIDNLCPNVSKENGQWEVMSAEICDTLQNLVDTVDTMTEKVSCIGVSDMECDEETDIPLMDEFKCPTMDSASNSVDSSQVLELAVFGDITCSDTFNELTSVDSPSFPPMLTACNNYVPHTVHEESLDNEPPELKNEIDDQTMISIDGDSSSSENEIDSDDEMADYLSERESNFSGDSYLSECSLDSSSSISFSSGESVSSESSSSPVPGEQDMEDSNLPPQNQNSNSESEKPQSQIPLSIYSLVSETQINLPTAENLDKVVTLTVSEYTEHPEIVSVTPPITNSKVEESSDKLEKNVPESFVMDNSESYFESVLHFNNETVSKDSVNNSKETSVPPNCVDNSELVTEQAITDTLCCSLPNVNIDDISSQQSEKQSFQTGHSLCADKSSDIRHSSNSNETVQVDRCNDPCIVSIENNSTDTIFAENTSQVIPESVKGNIFVSEELPDSSCTNTNSVEVLDESLEESADTIPVSENSNSFSNKRLLTYENVIAEHGLVFKDMDTSDFENIKDIPEERSNFPPFDMYHLASINSVSWNPNYGSHFWLFSAGQSGIARLSYISEINRDKYFKRN